ncbi:MAG: cation diffusion facilitator family transporter [Myxococcota bacterium]
MSAPPPTDALAARHAAVRKVLWWILVANWVVAAAKLALGIVAQSTAMTADGLHSFIDGGSNIIGLVAMHFASQPADDEHPYGHQKFEALASLAIGVMIGMGVLELGRMAFNAIINDVHPTVGPLQVAVMVATLFINLAVTRIEAAQGRKLNSTLLLADASHTMSDIFVTLAVIASLLLTWLGVSRVDGVVALAVLVFVAWTGWQIIRQSVGILADSARVNPLKVRELIDQVPRVLGVRSIRSRGLEGSVLVDLTIHVDPTMDLKTAHDVADDVEARISAAFPEVIEVMVHVEPAP